MYKNLSKLPCQLWFRGQCSAQQEHQPSSCHQQLTGRESPQRGWHRIYIGQVPVLILAESGKLDGLPRCSLARSTPNASHRSRLTRPWPKFHVLVMLQFSVTHKPNNHLSITSLFNFICFAHSFYTLIYISYFFFLVCWNKWVELLTLWQ